MANSVITINVGGSLYTTSVETLTRNPDSKLSNLITDHLASVAHEPGSPTKDGHGHFVIDRDGPLFRYVLNFLRESSLTLPEDFKELELLIAEAEFYQIQPLVESVRALQDRRIFIEEERRVQRKTIRPMEYVEVELYVGHSWFVYGTAQALNEIPYFAKYYAQFTKKIPTHHYNIPKLENPEAYGMQLMQGTRDEPLNRVKMLQEASKVGFRLLCTSSSGGDGRLRIRWILAREVASRRFSLSFS